jgi:hypothetical protein
MTIKIGRLEERVAMRVSWFVERIGKGASSPHWCTERMNMWEVLQDLAAAKDAGDHFRFIAPSSATDQDLDALLRRGAMPTFPAFRISSTDSSSSGNISKKSKASGGEN